VNHAVRAAALIFGLVGAAAPAAAQPNFVGMRDAKTQEGWYASKDWTYDLDVAKERSTERGKVIFAYFTRSYSIVPGCQALERGLLVSPEFAEFAEGVVLLAHIESRIPGDKHADLLKKCGGKTQPHFAFLDAEGAVIGVPTGASVAAFQAGVGHAQAILELSGKDDLKKADRVRLLVAKITLGKVTLSEAEAERGKISGLSRSQKKELDASLVDLRVADVIKNNPVRSAEDAAKVGKILYKDFYRKKQRPQGGSYKAFYALIMRYGEEERDVKIFEAGLEGLKVRYGDDPREERRLARAEETLETLRKK
jgi:hypothetical protein